ncbi:gamma-aminobutyrate:proton symporter (AAT family) [Brevibacterium sanguinis]|uniref:Gamma-aminobutyrate:proton symporter (AAT family) n=2 Tax=Brevibacterium TaxID=1696 RepID=A0A366IJB3_9MICO|nr:MULTISPECIES: amino acid permease [Brevibacterium]RBP62014.1 gamma-aminobutyrate:proton symporter (AAT family) [Brevibacterium sanguinis]RBP70564.1 gamma-aminobutyrate:proton symporter (AAT family) [Brevibacterium celere]
MGAPPTELKKGLKQRHLTMIAMGGVIGAGLFVGSGVVIGETGPATFLAYALTGVLVILIMRMLGEMAVANPSTGSFADYAREALGSWAGFSSAWLYWYFWVIVVGFEAVAGAKIIQFWLPEVPLWVLSLILMALMTATNLFSVSSFGEFEFWFAGVKVAAIIVFLALGTFFVLGLWPGQSLDFSNLWAHGGFFPNGVGTIFTAGVVIIFSMVGAEIATIAAAESPDPGHAIAKATNSVILRIAVFFVGSIFLLTAILPWNSENLAASPYVSAFQTMGIPFADHIMNAVVLTAVLSCLNSGLYTASRMLFVLAARREAPVALMKVGRRGVPFAAILSSSVVGFLCVIAAAISEDKVFLFLLNSSGAVILFVYLLIAVSQVVLRRRTPDAKLTVKMWLFPGLSIIVILAIVAVLVQMLFDPDTRSQLLLSLLSWAVLLVVFFATKRIRDRGPVETPEAAPTGDAHRVLVLANETVEGTELLDELRAIDRNGDAEYLISVPANPIDTGQAMHSGAVYIWDRTVQAAQERVDRTVSLLQSENLDVRGELGDYRPLRALTDSVESFRPDQIVICTLPLDRSAWLRFDVVDRAKEMYPRIPVRHVIVHPEPAEAQQ